MLLTPRLGFCHLGRLGAEELVVVDMLIVGQLVVIALLEMVIPWYISCRLLCEWSVGFACRADGPVKKNSEQSYDERHQNQLFLALGELRDAKRQSFPETSSFLEGYR